MIVSDLGLIFDIEKFFSWTKESLIGKKYPLPAITGLPGSIAIELTNISPIHYHGDTIVLTTGLTLHFHNAELSTKINLSGKVEIGFQNVDRSNVWILPIEVQSVELDKTTSVQLLSDSSITVSSTINSLIDHHWEKLSNLIQEQINTRINEEVNSLLYHESSPKVINWSWKNHSEGIKTLTFNYQNTGSPNLTATTLIANIQTKELINRITDNGLPSFQIQSTVILVKQIHVIDNNKISIDIETEDGKIRLCAFIKLHLMGNQIIQKVENIQWIEGGFLQKTLFRMLREFIINKIESRQLNLEDAWTLAKNKFIDKYPFLQLQNPNLSEVSTLNIDKEVTTIQCSFIA